MKMKARLTILLALLVIPFQGLAQTSARAYAAYIYNGSSWNGAPTTSSTGASSYIPSQIAYLYCYNSSLNQWVPASSACFGGSGSGFPITLGTTSIASGSTTTSVAGLTVNGVTLTAAGSTTLFLNQAGGYTSPTGSGTVTSVGLTVPAWLTVGGSPVTTSGTLAITATTGETANEFLATPNGSSGALGLRAIVAADIPTLNQNTSGSAASLSATLACGEFPALTGNVTTSAGSCATTVAAAPLSAITGLGTSVATALGIAIGSAGAPVTNGGALGTPSSGVGTNLTGIPLGALTGLGTGVATALGDNVGSAGALVTNGGALGTPSSGTGTNLTGIPTTRTVQFSFGTPGGSAISAGVLGYQRMPYACTGLASWSITVDAGTATVKTWKIASGTAIPTTSNSISTSGVAISTGTNITSTTVTDFTTQTTTANDIIAADLSAVSGVGFIGFELVYTGCTQ